LRASARRHQSLLGGLGWFIPASILLLAAVCYPILRTIVLSFVHENLATGFRAEFAGLDNFRRIIVDSRLHAAGGTTLFFTLVSVGAEFLIGLLLALSVESLSKWRSFVRVVCLVPWIRLFVE
jgi:multiple sugar transport system permease protein